MFLGFGRGPQSSADVGRREMGCAGMRLVEQGRFDAGFGVIETAEQ